MSAPHETIEVQPNKPNKLRRAAAAATIAAAALTGAACSAAPHSAHAIPKPAAAAKHALTTPKIGPCFDKPIPQPKSPGMPTRSPNSASPNFAQQAKKWSQRSNAYAEINDPPKLTLKRSSFGDWLQGDPIFPSDQAQAKILGGIVQIKTSTGEGSGFLVRGRGGEEVAVTAVHVVAGAKGLIDVIDNNSNKATVTGGCYVYQDAGKSTQLRNEEVQDVDIAILDLSKPLGDGPLTFADQSPQRGEWGVLTNFQESFDGGGLAGAPTEYTAPIIAGPTSSLGYTALTGISPTKGLSSDAYSDMPGDSGGLFANASTGQIMGMTYAGLEKNEDVASNTIETDTLQGLSSYNVGVAPNVAAEKGFDPSEVQLIPPSEIEYTLTSTRY